MISVRYWYGLNRISGKLKLVVSVLQRVPGYAPGWLLRENYRHFYESWHNYSYYFALQLRSHVFASGRTSLAIYRTYIIHSVTTPNSFFTRHYYYYRYYLTSTTLYCITRRRTMRVSVFGVPTRPVPPPPTGPEQPVLRTRLCNLSRVHHRFRFDVFFTVHQFNVLLKPSVRTHAYLFFLNSSCARVCRRGIKPF